VDYLTTHTSLSQIWLGFAHGFVNYKKGCIRLAVASDQIYQLLAHGRWFSPGTPVSSTTKTGRHDIAEILLKVALSTINQSNQSLENMLLNYGILNSPSAFLLLCCCFCVFPFILIFSNLFDLVISADYAN
jgi:hypothetical protein